MLEKRVKLRGHSDGRGLLVSLESFKNVPFDIKRVYYLTHLDQAEARGYHAHRQLNQLAVCVSGGCDFVLDDGQFRVTVRLEDPTEGLLIGKMIWREMHNFTDDCVLMVLADAYYDVADYIRNYDEFKRLVNV